MGLQSIVHWKYLPSFNSIFSNSFICIEHYEAVHSYSQLVHFSYEYLCAAAHCTEGNIASCSTGTNSASVPWYSLVQSCHCGTVPW